MEATFSGLQNQTSKNWLGRMFSRTYKSLSEKPFIKARLWSYDDIQLKLFLDIASNGGFERLVLEGSVSDEKLLEHWEEIVQRNSKENENLQYQAYFSLVKGYSALLAQHTTIKLWLMRCQITGSNDAGFKENVESLRMLGYKIDTSSSLKYAESIALCFNQSNSIVTKIGMKQVEIKDYMKRTEKSKGSDGFSDIIANLEEALGGHRSLSDDITLSKYNSLKKIAKAKAVALKAAQRKR